MQHLGESVDHLRCTYTNSCIRHRLPCNENQVLCCRYIFATVYQTYSTSQKSLNKRLTSRRVLRLRPPTHWTQFALRSSVCVRLRLFVFTCVRLRLRAFACVPLRPFASACVCVHLRASACVYVRLRASARVYVRLRASASVRLCLRAGERGSVCVL